MACDRQKCFRGPLVCNQDIDPAPAEGAKNCRYLTPSAGHTDHAPGAFQRSRFDPDDPLHERRFDGLALRVEEPETDIPDSTQTALLSSLDGRKHISTDRKQP